MGKRREFRYPSRDGRTRIHAVEWRPEGEPVGVCQIVHGVAEYALRYAPFAEHLAEKGFVVVANDHIGHGWSVAGGAPKLYFGETNGWWNVADDLHDLRVLTRARYPGLPYVLLGHSMGSFLARTDLIRHPGAVDAAIVMGTGQLPRPLLSFGLAAARTVGDRFGYDRPSALLDRLAFGTYNRPFAPRRTDHDWLSVNEENVDAFLADPLCGGTATVGLFRDMLRGIAFIEKDENLRRMDPSTPVLFVSGEMDPVGDLGKGVRRAYESFRRAGVRDVEMTLYPGLRHEILNEREAERDYVRADILAWIRARVL